MGLGVALMIEGGTAKTVPGPIAGNPTLSQGAFRKAPAGYLFQEFFLSGSAAAYGLSDETLSVTGHAPFQTLLVVVHAADDETDGKIKRRNCSHKCAPRMPACAWNYT